MLLALHAGKDRQKTLAFSSFGKWPVWGRYIVNINNSENGPGFNRQRICQVLKCLLEAGCLMVYWLT